MAPDVSDLLERGRCLVDDTLGALQRGQGPHGLRYARRNRSEPRASHDHRCAAAAGLGAILLTDASGGCPGRQRSRVIEGCSISGPTYRFLRFTRARDSTGASHALPSSDFSAKQDVSAVVAKLHGTPYFSLDVSDIGEKQVQETLEKSAQGCEGIKLEFMIGQAAMGSLSQFDSSVFAEARSLVDWSARNKACVILWPTRIKRLICPEVLRRVWISRVHPLGRLEARVLIPITMGGAQRETLPNWVLHTPTLLSS